jgi:hypothetical protein
MEQVENLVLELGFNNMQDAAKKHINMIILGKISKYEAEYNHFKNKYNCEYTELAEKSAGLENVENFEQEDDLLDWRFAYEQIQNYKDKLKSLTV